MLTRRGLGALIAGALLYGAAIVSGYVELAVLAAGALVAVAVGLAWVLRRPTIEVTRRIEPERVTRGDPAFGTLRLVNPGRLVSAAATAVEPCGTTTKLQIEIPRLASGQSVSKRYRLPTDRRAAIDIGPLEVVRSDPLGLWETARRAGAVQRLWVHPVVHALFSLPAGRTRSLEGRSSDRMPHGSITFHSLREYVIGDDLRLVHWRSSAKTGTLMVRENVDTSLPQMTVVLDTRRPLYDEPSFEEAVEAAASVVVAATNARYPVRLLTTGGRAVGGQGLTADAGAFLDMLAEIGLTDDAELRPLMGVLANERRSDTFVAITGNADADDIAVLGALARRYDDAVIAVVSPSAAMVSVSNAVSARVVRAATGEEFAARWNQAMLR